jgi:hypothetical protein
MVGFWVDRTAQGDVIHVRAGATIGEFDLDMASENPDHDWEMFLSSGGFGHRRNEPFLRALEERSKEALRSNKTIDWTEMVQLVLNDIPSEVVSHLDFKGAEVPSEKSWPGPGYVNSSAIRLTRDAIYRQPAAEDFFNELDARQAWIAEVTALEPRERVEAVVEKVLGEGETSLGDALRMAFPEAEQGALAPGDDLLAEHGLIAMVNAWVGWNVPGAEDEPETPRP